MSVMALPVNNHAVKVRFLANLLGNGAKLVFSFIAGIIVARAFGPANFGDLNFLLGSFSSIMVFLDLGTSSAFYTFISQRRRGARFYLYYFAWTIGQFSLVLFLVTLIFPETWISKIWLGHSKGVIVLAFLASFAMNNLWQVIVQTGESIRATVTLQWYNVLLSLFYLCVVFLMVQLRCMTIPIILALTAILYLISSYLLLKRLKNSLIADENITYTDMLAEFKSYCTPLAIYSVVNFIYSFADIWLLQKFGGAIQQGLFSVGIRFSSICLIATGSILSIFWKEVAEANEHGDTARIYHYYTKITRALCFVSALLACLLIPFSREILIFLLGPKYESGWFCLSIMFLYPVHQSLGMISGAYFYATKKTALYSKLSMVQMLSGVPVAYILLAPISNIIPGFGLGSAGLALKMEMLILIWANVSMYIISRLEKWEFNVLYQFQIIGSLLLFSFAIKMTMGYLFRILNIAIHPVQLMGISITVYICVAGLFVYMYPGLVGLDRDKMRDFIRYLFGFINRKKAENQVSAHFARHTHDSEVMSWLNDDELRNVSSSGYWNDEEIEKKKEWFIPGNGNEKISSYLDQETTFRKQLESVLRFARSNNLEVKGVGVDIAAGVGWATAILSKLESLDKIYALEISRHRLVKISPRVFDIFGADRRKIIRVLGSFYDIRLPDRSVDFCFMSQAFHHAGDPQKLLSEVYRILKPSGFILIMGEEPIGTIDLFIKYIKNMAKICLPDSMYQRAPVYKAFPSFRELYPSDEEAGDCYYRIKDYKDIFRSAGFSLHQNKKRHFTTLIALKR